MTIKELLKIGQTRLNIKGYDDSNIISKQLLSKILHEKYEYTLINADKNIEEKECKKFLSYIDEIINGKPLQYITKRQEFMGYAFFVDENVLIPQPDTEVVVENCMKLCIEFLKNKGEVNILDLCTGSGAIAISLYKMLNIDKFSCKRDNINVFASDVSANALNIAIKNNIELNTNVKFIESDMFNNINNKFNIIVSNPPYIETNIIKELPKDVQAEPRMALDGGKDGLNYYRIIAKEAKNYLYDNGYICLEIGYNQANCVKEIFKENYTDIEIIKDLSGNDRCLICRI